MPPVTGHLRDELDPVRIDAFERWIALVVRARAIVVARDAAD